MTPFGEITHWLRSSQFDLGERKNSLHFVDKKRVIFKTLHYEQVLACLLPFPCCCLPQIYHLASPASPPHYMYNPVKTIKTNTVGTINMLGEATVHCIFLDTNFIWEGLGTWFKQTNDQPIQCYEYLFRYSYEQDFTFSVFLVQSAWISSYGVLNDFNDTNLPKRLSM